MISYGVNTFSLVGIAKYSFRTRMYMRYGAYNFSYQIFFITLSLNSSTVFSSIRTTDVSHKASNIFLASTKVRLSLKRAFISMRPAKPAYDKLLDPVITLPGNSPPSFTASEYSNIYSLAWHGSSVLRISRVPFFIFS